MAYFNNHPFCQHHVKTGSLTNNREKLHASVDLISTYIFYKLSTRGEHAKIKERWKTFRTVIGVFVERLMRQSVGAKRAKPFFWGNFNHWLMIASVHYKFQTGSFEAAWLKTFSSRLSKTVLTNAKVNVDFSRKHKDLSDAVNFSCCIEL